MKIHNIILFFILVVMLVPSVMSSTLDERTLGDDNARVTIEMFADFEDPYSAKWHAKTLPQIENVYINQGKVKLVVKHYPLSLHSRAKSASIAAECAAEQDEFYDYIDLLYLNQQDLQDNDLITYAEEVSIDVDQFTLCFESASSESEVKDDIEEGNDRSVTGTPAFFINGEYLVGAQPFDTFDSVVKEAFEDDYDDEPRDQQREPVKGDSNAKIKIIGYMEFSDPFSQKAWVVINDLFDEFGDDIKFEFRNFPLSFQDPNNIAAQAGECVLDQSNEKAFFKFADMLMSRENNDETSLISQANSIGINIEDCLANKEFLPEVLEDIEEGEIDNVQGTPAFILNGELISGAQPYEVFEEKIKTHLATDVDEPKDLQREPVIGDKSAQVKMVGYIGYNDPYSKRAWNTLDLLFEEFGDNIKFEFRNFPLSFQDPNNVAAQAGECVLDQAGEITFSKFSNSVLDNNDSVYENDLIRIASQNGADIERCLQSQTMLSEVLDDIENGKDDDISGTPTFFINGKKLTGAQPYATFVEVISEELGRDSYVKEFCGDNICQSDEDKKTCPYDCEVVDEEVDEDIIEEVEKEVCSESQIKKYSCTDNSQVNWCECIGEGWVCVSNPQYLCPQEIKDTCSQGCVVEGKCIPYGQRLLNNNENSYCSLIGDFFTQKADSTQCQNSYECASNQCNSGICVDLSKELKETKSLLEKILGFFSNWFK
jgi:protein-disulfide isomerase